MQFPISTVTVSDSYSISITLLSHHILFLITNQYDVLCLYNVFRLHGDLGQCHCNSGRYQVTCRYVLYHVIFSYSWLTMFQNVSLAQRPLSTQPPLMASCSRKASASSIALSSRLVMRRLRVASRSATSTSAALLALHSATAALVARTPMVSWLSPIYYYPRKIAQY